MQSRPNLSAVIAEQLRTRFAEGTLAPGERINEVQLASALGVSRTPLREALNQLTSEGFLDAEPRRGYFVRPLHASELRHLYVLRQLLDPAALASAGLPSGSQLERLRALNTELERTTAPLEVIALDDRWHLDLLSHCTNPFLIADIRRYMNLTRRYEIAYFRQADSLSVATDEHTAILDALATGDLEGGCKALTQNLTSAIDPLEDWLSKEEAK